MPENHDHNHWKTWPYWAKGASITTLIAVVFIVFQSILAPALFYGTCGTTPCMLPAARTIENIFAYSLLPMWSSPLSGWMLDYQWVFIIVALVYYFVIGAFIGILIEKLRKS